MTVPLIIRLHAFRPATLLIRDSNTGVFLRILLKNFKNTYFEEHLREAASDLFLKVSLMQKHFFFLSFCLVDN